LGVPIYQSLDYAHQITQLEVGFYVWQFSLLGTATWFLWMLYRRPVLLVAMSLVAVSFLFGSAVITPEYIARRDLRKAVREAEGRIAAFEHTGQPESVSFPGWELTKFVNAGQPGMRDFQLATGYMQDIYTWRQRERISDSLMMDRYPEVAVHFPDAAHPLPELATAHDGTRHNEHDSVGQPWMEYRDLRPAALKRAKLYLRNAELELGMSHGQRQLPDLLGSADLTGVSPFDKRDVPARFSKTENLVQIQRAGTQALIPADNHTALGKQDIIITATSSTATIVFDDKSACVLGPASQVQIEENSVNLSGRTFVKVELVNGKIALDSVTRIYRSSAQVEFVTVPGTVELGPESSMEVQSDSRTSITQVLVKKGSAEVRLRGEAALKLLERDRYTFANGLRSKTTDPATLAISSGSH
jgi:hypothetical protein